MLKTIGVEYTYPGTVIYLNRKAENMKGDKTEQSVRIWVDESKGKIETNNSDHTKKVLIPTVCLRLTNSPTNMET